MKKLFDPFQRFVALESSSSIILFLSAFIALFWANSEFSQSYFSTWNTNLTFGIGTWTHSKPLILWINDGLMAIFFFVIGLEIKKEIVAGELSSLQKAALPIVAATGGMIVPILIFLLLNHNQPGADGWGIPMATDIAFSLGILQLLGKRVPLSLKIFLTAFAIVDDLGAIAVIAIFYSHQLFWIYLLGAAAILTILIIANMLNVNAKWLFVVGGTGIWYLFLLSGIHPTIAGVIVALTIPVNRRIGLSKYSNKLLEKAKLLECKKTPKQFLNKTQLGAIESIEYLNRQVQPMLQRFENRLHGFVAYFVMPIFALSNAGVVFLSLSSVSDSDFTLSLNLAESMLIGKIVGISLFSWLAIKTKIAALPKGISFKHIVGVSILGGFGFTMSLFIGSLAYSDSALLASGKIGILAGSIIAGVLGYLVLRLTLPNHKPAVATK